MEAAGGGEDEGARGVEAGAAKMARGRGRRRTGERPGGVVVQGCWGVEAAELERRSGTAAEQIKNCAQVLEEGGGRRDI